MSTPLFKFEAVVDFSCFDDDARRVFKMYISAKTHRRKIIRMRIFLFFDLVSIKNGLADALSE